MQIIWIPVWKKAPFIRLLIPAIIGILLQWYLHFQLLQISIAAVSFISAAGMFAVLPISVRFKLQAVQGFLFNIILIVIGILLTYQKDIRHEQNWFGNIYHDSDYIVVTINEPLLEKARSSKADGKVNAVIQNDSIKTCTGNLLLYFAKDSIPIDIKYGDKILIHKKLQLIQNSGNPGAFDYQRYAAFKQVFHNVFLKRSDWILLKEKNIDLFRRFIFKTRQNILSILQQNMKSHDDELSIAEALLIGYTQDLDKDLVQAYSNTGVVHIIAISGLHLGLIYCMLVWIFNKIPFIKRSKLTKVILILSSLWLFSLLTGGSASVLRSAVMFSCIVIGENFARRSSIYNSLAASAFILLCYNPFFLWDVGFQLSYLAVLGIVIFQKPLYHLFFIKNKWVNKVWELAAVSLSAQIFTFPICLYYFHQFPNTFLFTNLIMVPLSSLILFVEIFLVAFAWIPLAANVIGKCIWALVWLMNKVILFFNDLPYAVYDQISASVTTTILLYVFVVCLGYWLLGKNKTTFKLSIAALLAFALVTVYGKWNIEKQQKLIVYNVPQYQAIDLINGNTYTFLGDPVLSVDGMLQNFHLKPARIALQLNKRTDQLSTVYQKNNFFLFAGKRILVIDSAIDFAPLTEKQHVDLIIISKNPKVYIYKLAEIFNCSQFVFDASNSLWKIGKWKTDCEQLHLPCHSVSEQGAFIMDL